METVEGSAEESLGRRWDAGAPNREERTDFMSNVAEPTTPATGAAVETDLVSALQQLPDLHDPPSQQSESAT